MQFRFEIIAPPPELSSRINTFYVIETGEDRIEEIVPAYSAQLVVMVRGRLPLEHSPEAPQPAGSVVVNAPQMRSSPCLIEGPALLLGASLTQIGWQALANRPADKVHDCLLPAQDIFTDAQIATLQHAAAECGAGRKTMADLSAALGDVVAAAPHTPRPDHVAVIEAMMRWLASAFDPPLDALHAMVDISPRQL